MAAVRTCRFFVYTVMRFSGRRWTRGSKYPGNLNVKHRGKSFGRQWRDAIIREMRPFALRRKPSEFVFRREAGWVHRGMSVVKSLWASVQGNPVFMRKVNGWLTIFWIAMIPFSVTFGLLNSVAYVSALSLWALVSGHWSAWQAARVEVTQQTEADEREQNPVEKRVVEQLVHDTQIERATNGPIGRSVSAPDDTMWRDLVDRLDRIESAIRLEA